MYVIFPLDQILDIKCAGKPKNLNNFTEQSGDLKRYNLEVLSPTYPSRKIPGHQQLTSPVSSAQTQLPLPSHEKVATRSTASSIKSLYSLPDSLQLPLQQVFPASVGTNTSTRTPTPSSVISYDPSTESLRPQVSSNTSGLGCASEEDTANIKSANWGQKEKNILEFQSAYFSETQNRKLGTSEIPRYQYINSDSFRLTIKSSQTSFTSRDRRSRFKSDHHCETPTVDCKVISEFNEFSTRKKSEPNRILKPDKKLCAQSVDSQYLPKPDSPKNFYFSDFEQHSVKEIFLPLGILESEVVESESSRTSSARSRNSTNLCRGAKGSTLGRGLTTLTPISHRTSVSLAIPTRSNMTEEVGLKDLTHPALNETLKTQNAVTFKLIKTVVDFTAQLSRLHERHAEDLQHLVENFRKKHSDLRNEKPPCSNIMFQSWKTLLQEVEVDSQLHSDVAGTLVKQVSRQLIEKTFHRKIQSRKLFTHRESIETILAKTEEVLKKCRKEHSEAYSSHCQNQNNSSLAAYFDAHNKYVQQLHATNAMLHYYNTSSLPTILQELEKVHVDVFNTFMDCMLQGTDIIALKSQEQFKRYDLLSGMCRNNDPRSDILSFVKYYDTPQLGHRGIPQHRFILPQPPAPHGDNEENTLQQEPFVIPPLKNELVLDRLCSLSSRSRSESLKKELSDLEKQIAAHQEGIDTLLRTQQRNLENSLYHKANELQEDISMKSFDLRVSEIHLAAVKAQKELFASKEGPNTDSRERKMSNSSTGSMKSKWMKAFKSLKPPAGSGGLTAATSSRDNDRRNGRDRGDEVSATPLFENSHILQEYTYKKITACDVCHQILRGHSRQGLKCRLCKINVHFECQERLLKCQPKSRLLRRQRSTSEIESKQMDAEDEETEPEISISTLIASQPGRRMKDPSSPSTPTSGSAPVFLPPSPNPAGRNPV